LSIFEKNRLSTGCRGGKTDFQKPVVVGKHTFKSLLWWKKSNWVFSITTGFSKVCFVDRFLKSLHNEENDWCFMRLRNMIHCANISFLHCADFSKACRKNRLSTGCRDGKQTFQSLS
jgi:hypothetical protein